MSTIPPRAVPPALADLVDVIDFASRLPVARPLMGIDVGTKTLGLALSDRTRLLASPLETIVRTKFTTDVARLMALANQHGVAGYVIGDPLNMDASRGPRAQATLAFARNLAALDARPILLWDERLSTVAAERALLEADASRRKRSEKIDMVAATLILRGALERMRGLDGQRGPQSETL
jgi:putative Holliday junction resolvase